MEIIFENGEAVEKELLEIMEKAAVKAVELEHLPAELSQISVTFADPEEIHRLNLEYRNVDRPTDVLSFPQYEIDELDYYAENPSDVVEELMLGDVVICREKAEEQAEEFGHSLKRELIYLFTHSVLHLLGYDHMEEAERAVMRAREEAIMDYLGIPRR